ncbi:MAG TPA: hypothetical protein VKA39_06085, partial [Beijerinckiaceae bacterium]|nr:hypothetical protein [Beijerinckiaceae bacterium]
MIYIAIGCAVRRGTSNPFRAHVNRPGAPGAARAFSRIRPNNSFVPTAREDSAVATLDSFKSCTSLSVGDKSYTMYS